MHVTRHLAGLSALLSLCAAAAAQASFPEVEPNGIKSEATAVNGMVANDTLTGLSTGTTTTANSTAATTVDMFRVKTGALPLGIYRHTLTLSNTTVGNTATIRGLLQATGVISTTDTTFQTHVTLATQERANTWYGFGKQEEVYYRVQGSASTTASYTARLSTAAVTPIAVPGLFAAGPITVTTAAQGHTTDTELYVYDGSLNPVALGHNDDLVGGIASSSTVTVTLAAGTYYVAVSDYNTANDQSDLNPTEAWDDGPVLDFPNAIANNFSTSVVNVAFSVSDGTTTSAVAATKATAYDVAWGTFTVTTGSTPSTTFCSGDAAGTTCVACGNNGSPGRGCANSSFPAGTLLSSSGIAGASAGTDTLVLTAADLPGPGLFFQANGLAASPVSFGDGMLCASVGIIRMGVVFPVAGTASYPGGLTPFPIHVAGAPISAGDTKHYQCWYRDALAFCTSATFNTSNGITLVWAP